MDHVIFLQDVGMPSKVMNKVEFGMQIEMLKEQLSSSLNSSSGAAVKGKVIGKESNDPTGAGEEDEKGQNEDGDENQIIKEEEVMKGSIAWKDYKEFFSYASFGMCGIVIIFILHIIINLCTMGVSLYLAFDLT